MNSEEFSEETLKGFILSPDAGGSGRLPVWSSLRAVVAGVSGKAPEGLLFWLKVARTSEAVCMP